MSKIFADGSYGKKFYYVATCPKCHDVVWAQTSFPDFDCHCCGTRVTGCKRVDERELEIIKDTGIMEK